MFQPRPTDALLGDTKVLTFAAAFAIAKGLTETPPPMKLAIPGMNVMRSIEMNKKITS